MDDSLVVVIKAAQEKFEIAVPATRLTTVAELKQMISVQHPSLPSPDSQRLIFAGKLLTEEQTIASIFPSVCLRLCN